MDTVRRTQTPQGWRLRHVRTLIAGTAVTAAALSVVGLTATAQALPVRLTAGGSSDPSVPAGVATSIGLPTCSSGTPTVTSSPALPATVTPVVNGTKSKIVGVWPTSPTKYTVTIACSGVTKKKHSTVTVESAPPENSAVGLGAQTQQSLLDQFSGDYNAKLSSSSATHLYNYDAVNPTNDDIGDTITVKQTCASFPRPDGSSAGIDQLIKYQQTSDGKYYCDNFANSSRARASTDPPFATGGVAFVDMAQDVVDWATQKTTDAPASLTVPQLQGIFTCSITNWDQVGGKNAPIEAFLPQSGSGTLTFWETTLGITPGTCVSDESNTLEENEGVNPVLNSPEVIWIYSVGDYIAQKFHSSPCTVTGCTGTPPCTPEKGKNEFGCDLHGTMVLKKIDGLAPTTGSGEGTKINTGFDSAFFRILYEVVPYDPNTTDHIPGSESGAPGGVDLENIFGASGWVCTNATAKLDIQNYGFLTTPNCGTAS